MTKQTSNHGWTIPEVDQTTNWGTVLNDFFDNALDEDVPLRDTIANRPSAGSSAPALFVSTDETPPRLYYNDGATWTQIGGSGTQLSEEEVDDFVANLITGGTNVSVNYDDANDTLTIDATDTNTQTEWSQSTVTSSTTAGNYDSIWVDASSAAVTVTLPTPTQSYRVAVTAVDASNTVTVARNGTESINGSASDLTLVEGESVTLESDGTNWQVV
jgi:hypothetical protein